ncbi:conserved membrane hypothetical protein [[Clostridium] ultunense Esp]|nr:conserved membrane hypothetical protein [[Clostridium] ultunense Esp]
MPYLNFLIYLLVSLVMLGLGLILFTASTKMKEFFLIGKRNKTAAMILGGKMLGLSLVLGSAIANSASLLDMILWGVIGMVAQVLIYPIAELLTVRYQISQAIEEDNEAVGILLLSLSLAVGWIIANNLTY